MKRGCFDLTKLQQAAVGEGHPQCVYLVKNLGCIFGPTEVTIVLYSQHFCVIQLIAWNLWM